MNSRISFFIPIWGHFLATNYLIEKYGDKLQLTRWRLTLVRIENMLIYFLIGISGGYLVVLRIVSLPTWLEVLGIIWLVIGTAELVVVWRWGNGFPRFLGWWRAKLLSREDFLITALATIYQAFFSTLLGTFLSVSLLQILGPH